VALPELASVVDVTDALADITIKAGSRPSMETVEAWTRDTRDEVVARLRGAGIDLATATLDEAAEGWLKTIVVRGTMVRVYVARKLWERAEDLRAQFYGDIARIERDPGVIGLASDSAGPSGLKRGYRRNRVTMTSRLW